MALYRSEWQQIMGFKGFDGEKEGGGRLMLTLADEREHEDPLGPEDVQQRRQEHKLRDEAADADEPDDPGVLLDSKVELHSLGGGRGENLLGVSEGRSGESGKV